MDKVVYISSNKHRGFKSFLKDNRFNQNIDTSVIIPNYITKPTPPLPPTSSKHSETKPLVMIILYI